MPIPNHQNWSAGMLLRWVLTRDRAAVLPMVDDYGARLIEGNSVKRIRPQGWDDVALAYYIDGSLPVEERLAAAVVRADRFVIPAKNEIYDRLREAKIYAQARRNGSGDIETIGPEQWGGLRFCSLEGRDIALPVDPERSPYPLACSLAAYLSGSVPAGDTPTVWVDPVFSAEEAMRLWPPKASSVGDAGSLPGEPSERTDEAPVPPPEICIEQADGRLAYVRRIADFRKSHSGRNPPVQDTMDGLEGDREWATRNSISRSEITRLRGELLKTKLGRPKSSKK
jgi:hypothetical protein